MARHKLTLEAQLRGVEKALASRRCPPQLKPGLRKRAEQLRGMIRRNGGVGAGLRKALKFRRTPRGSRNDRS